MVPKIGSGLVAATALGTILCLTTTFPVTAGKPQGSSNEVSGEAYGVFADVTDKLSLAHITAGPTPYVVLPSNGGMDSEQVLNIRVPADGSVVTSETLTVITTGAIGSSDASAQSSATVEEVDILNGLVTADLVVAMSSSTGNGSTASSNAEGSVLVGLKVDGVFMGDITPAPNTTIPIPGVGAVILNEQIWGGDGVSSTALTVNMIHVKLNGLLTGDVVVSSAHSDVGFAPATKKGPLFFTGGGRLGVGSDFATFGLHAGKEKNGKLQGQLQYIDHPLGLNVHSTSITSFAVDGDCVTFSGAANVNGANGTFTVELACDHDEPGIGIDYLSISVGGYHAEGTLTGGNFQLHAK